MESMMKLPDDMFRQELLQYLIVDDLVNLDNACMNNKYRPHLLDKISGVILIGDKDKSMISSLFEWLGMRRIYLINMLIMFSDFYLVSSIMQNNYVDQFRYTQHVIMRLYINDDMAVFILSRCPVLLSIDILASVDHYSSSSQLTDITLLSIAEHCTGLQSISLSNCRQITDTGLKMVSENCTSLQNLNIVSCNQITDASIISISIHCTGLKKLHLEQCHHITDASIISISNNSFLLQSLRCRHCDGINKRFRLFYSRTLSELRTALSPDPFLIYS
jgi:hypothetical protein